jgi:hypothetical protein
MSVKSDKPSRPRRVLLAEDDLALGAMQRSPGADAPLQSAPDAGTDLGMAPSDLVENGEQPQPRRALQQGHHLAVPNRGQRILPPATPRHLLL